MARLRKKVIRNHRGQKAVVRVSQWFPPYVKVKGKWRATLPYYTKAQCGAYLVRSRKTRKILYVGHSGKQLYKTIYRHFQSWEDDQYRSTYESRTAYEIMVILTPSCNNAFMIESYYQHKLKPRDNRRGPEVRWGDLDFNFMPQPAKIESDPLLDAQMEIEDVPF